MKNNNLLFGIHAVLGALDNQPDQIECLYLSKDRTDLKMQHAIDIAKKRAIKIEYFSRHELDQLAQSQHHQGMVALFQSAKPYYEQDLAEILVKLTGPALLLVLDGVQDPHNLGACLRSAAAAGAHAVIAPKDKSVGLTPAVRKVATGAAEMVPFIQVTNLARTLNQLKEKNIWVFGLDAAASNVIYRANLTVSLALILGSEGSGMRRLTRECCDEIYKIPMHEGDGAIASLNVSVTAGIGLFEVLRQRQFR